MTSAAEPGPAAPSSEEFRAVAGCFATGVTVVATAWEEICHGMTVNAFASVSLDPLLVLVCVDRDAGMHDLLARSGRFAVTVLAEDQEPLSVFFASPRRPSGQDQFDEVAWRPAPISGSPILEGGLAWMDCEVAELHDGGDHTIFVGRVGAVGLLRAGAPLVFYRGAYRELGPGSQGPAVT